VDDVMAEGANLESVQPTNATGIDDEVGNEEGSVTKPWDVSMEKSNPRRVAKIIFDVDVKAVMVVIT